MNIQSLRFTIIIPTKNRRQILGQLLDSIGALNDYRQDSSGNYRGR